MEPTEQPFSFDDMAVPWMAFETGKEATLSCARIDTIAFDVSRLMGETEADRPESSADETGDSAVVCALKSTNDKQYFDKERRMLAACNEVKHAHIIPLLAAFTLRGTYHLILPQATSDLMAFWLTQQPSSQERDYATTEDWALGQVKGLATALHAIHYKLSVDGRPVHGLHGDVKAKNILLFAPESVRKLPGTLKLADLASSDLSFDQGQGLHSDYSGTYESPENFMQLQETQKSDIWGFGCLLLEFVVWLTSGSDGLRHFAEARVQHDHGFGLHLENDYFFQLSSPKDHNGLSRSKITNLNSCIPQLMHHIAHTTASARIKAMLEVIENSLLVLDVDKRIGAKQLVSIFNSIC